MLVRDGFAAGGFWIDRKDHAVEIDRREFI